MNKNAKKMYVAPSIKEHVVELEQGIAAGSGTGTPAASPGLNDYAPDVESGGIGEG